jgi:glycosyltransferase involved in cell wall biosynthesis
VEEAIASVINQTYGAVQIIIVDDCSEDNSSAIIQKIALHNPQLQVILLPHNLGNCKAFNLAFPLAKGKYIIDFATDDVMLPQRIEQQVAFFELQQENVGVIFSNALLISESGDSLGKHVESNAYVPQGDVFAEILRRYFICPPTMMFKKQVFDSLGGYDEALAYEDFDFWVRASRKFFFLYQDEVYTKRRIVATSHARNFVRYEKMTESTRKVCEKAFLLCNSSDELNALKVRVAYELFFAFRHRHWNVVVQYQYLLQQLDFYSLKNILCLYIAKLILFFVPQKFI